MSSSMFLSRRVLFVALTLSFAVWATSNYGVMDMWRNEATTSQMVEEKYDDGLRHETLRRSDFPDAPISPYEQRNPGYTLPNWAGKPFFMRQPKSYKGPQVCFVHVGKTAGSTIGCLLGFNLHCPKTVRNIHEGYLPTASLHTLHNSVNDCPDEQDYYLFVLRDPLQRMQSWFAYERPSTTPTDENKKCRKARQELFVDCPYPTLNDLAERGLGNPNEIAAAVNVTEVCRERARQAMAGEVGYCRHNKYNYAYFQQATPADGTVLAIRTEHLRDDWNSAEAYIASEEEGEDAKPYQVSEESFPRRNKSRKSYEDTHLSLAAHKLLCEALCPDIQVYKTFLHRAVNLTPEQIAKSLEELRRSCPKQARKSTC